MRIRILLLLITLAMLAIPSSAAAAFAHAVAPGESLSSVAAADGLSVSSLAAANGLAPDAQLVAGSTLQIPPQTGGAGPAVVAPATGAGSSPVAASAAPASGAYTVMPGDTLSAIAGQYGLTVDELAAANGLDPNGLLPAGTVLSLSGGSSSTAGSAAPAASGGSGRPQPTAEQVSASQIGSIAAAGGVSPSLAEAIGYQESGFNNNLVSSTGAIGVMQIEPGTWNYIGQSFAPVPPLSPASAQDNIRAGVLLLRSLLAQTNGDPAQAAAAYYQGLASVRARGMYADTQQYVRSVLALQRQFGGP